MSRSHHRLALLTTTGVGLLGALVLAARAGRPRGDDSLPLPGDDLVPGATMIETHQIDIDAPAAAVWPWLVQLGYERGGFYSFDLLERLAGVGITNAWRIEPRWQDLAVGDRVRLAADAALTVARLEPGHCLVLSSDGGVAPPGQAWTSTSPGPSCSTITAPVTAACGSGSATCPTGARRRWWCGRCAPSPGSRPGG